MGNKPLTKEVFLAARVSKAVEEFVATFGKVGAPGELRRLFDGKRLDGGKIQQQPEDFTEQYLIQPCLEALGYEDLQSDGVSADDVHHRHEPSEFPKAETNHPDFKLVNVDPQLVCIVESKKVNGELLRTGRRDATADVETYLRSNTFAKHLREQDKRVLVGVGSDGFRWSLWAKDVVDDTLAEDIKQISIESEIRTTAANILYDGPAEEGWRVPVEKQLRKKLVRGFSPENLPRCVKVALGCD